MGISGSNDSSATSPQIIPIPIQNTNVIADVPFTANENYTAIIFNHSGWRTDEKTGTYNWEILDADDGDAVLLQFSTKLYFNIITTHFPVPLIIAAFNFIQGHNYKLKFSGTDDNNITKIDGLDQCTLSLL